MKLKSKTCQKQIFIFIIVILAAIIVQSSFAQAALLKVNLLNQDPNPASAGDTFKVRFQVENIGASSANNVVFSLSDAYPFTVIQDKSQTIPFLGAYQTGNDYVNVEFTVKIDSGANAGEYPLQVQYADESGTQTIKTYNIDVTNKEYAQIIYVDKAQIDPGKVTQLNFTINNVGNAPLQNLVFSWNEASGVILPVYSDDTRYIKYLDPGSSVTISYDVMADVSANAGLYQLNLNLKFDSLSNTTTSTISTKAGVFVGGKTDFDVAFSESTSGVMSFTIANIGSNPATSVSVSVPDQENWQVTGSNSVIIGNLNKGDYTVASFKLQQQNRTFIKSTSTSTSQQLSQSSQQFQNISQGNENIQRNITRSSSNGNLILQISYTDTMGERQVIQKEVKMSSQITGASSSAQTSAQFKSRASIPSYVWYLIAVVVLVAGIIFYRGYRKKKQEKAGLSDNKNETKLKKKGNLL